MNEQASVWLTAANGLPAIHDRLNRVVNLNRDALDVIRQLGDEYSHAFDDTVQAFGAAFADRASTPQPVNRCRQICAAQVRAGTKYRSSRLPAL
jgi:hypothetical protein